MRAKNLIIDKSWAVALKEEFDSKYFANLMNILTNDQQKYEIFPPDAQIFAALNATPLQNVKVVLLGQDPYHGPRQANGLSFSVADGVKIPPSLVNIFKELNADIGISPPLSGNLEKWAKQGVLLLNTSLTVRSGMPGFHKNIGWEVFTNKIIQTVSDSCTGVVFLLWGKFAQSKIKLIDVSKHLVLEAPHPSPLSVYRGFYGCKHFSKANNYLCNNDKKPIDWNLL